ncbi:MAG: transcriptional repressor [Candidatus Azobacteroides sp.]|nr:transcriptional repressor [Candidatus Azobacteroides sp.]
MNNWEIRDYLVNHNIKPSVQRVAIMQYLVEHRTHPTIDEIYSELLPEVPTLSKTTVYNTLKLFHDNKAVLSLTIDEKNVRFDWDTTPHAHFKCNKCGKIYDVPLQESDIPSFRGESEFVPEETQVYFLGTCKKCI